MGRVRLDAATMPDGDLLNQRVLRTPDDLVGAGLIDGSDRGGIAAVGARYAVAIPPALLALIEAPDDPIGLQFIPHAGELVVAAHEAADPIGDDALSPVRGIVHRYPDRVLLKPLLICPTYCRFCFRREHVGPDGGLLTAGELEAAYAYIAARPAICEVILTGGDPLMLSARRLGEMVGRLSAIPHVQVIRVHTRVPVAEPGRLTAELAGALVTGRALFVVVHTNHARELTSACAAALRRVQVLGIPVLSQSVLLRGVNDEVATLEALFLALLRLRVKPYYLHQLDPAPGTARFAVPVERGRALMAELRGRISGMALPSYVVDSAGGKVRVG
jgi:lysine 2,3-aminomutase